MTEPTKRYSQEPFTQAEFREWFDGEMPLELVRAAYGAPSHWTVGQVRAEIRRLADEKKAGKDLPPYRGGP